MQDSWNNFLNTDLKESFIQEINEKLEEELKKPVKKRDYDRIEKLTKTYAELMGIEEQEEISMQCCLLEVKSRVKPKRKVTKNMRVVFATVSIAVMLFVMNIITVSAFNMNIFSFIVNIVDGGFSVDSPVPSSEVPDDDIIELSATPDDPYGMIAECAKYGIYPETPHYLPDGYVLTVCEFIDMPSFSKTARFTFTNRHNAKQTIGFTFDLYEDEKNIATVNFPNDEHNLSEIKINDKPAIFAEEQKDKQFKVVYPVNTLLSVIFTQNISKEEINQIINSIK